MRSLWTGSIGAGCLAWLLVAATAGCGSPEARYRLNLVQVKKVGDLPQQQERDVADILAAMFGTPDDPRVPVLDKVDIGSVIDAGKLHMSAGAVGSDEDGRPRGLYRKHCAHCHGITGDGAGPTAAFLNPYPRDYRRGTYKFKSTPSDLPPTHQDLKRVLVNGIAGTAMPSFKLLDEDELESLVQYVKYLSIRGQVERLLIADSADELEPEDRLINLADERRLPEQLAYLQDIAQEVVAKWVDAGENLTPIPAPPANWETSESVVLGRQLFFTDGGCAKCHGDLAVGDGQTTDYDEWTKEWFDPKNGLASANEFLALEALPPRTAMPRNLRQGVYRGGLRPIDLYRRVKQGIAGSPMPAAAAKLTSDDVWHLVAYVRSLPYESISRPKGGQALEFQRDRS